MSSKLSAKELLNLGDDGRIKPALNVYWPEILGVVFGVGIGCFVNFQTRRPAFSGIQKHILGAGGLSVLFRYFENGRNDYLAEKDAVLRHYIKLHPEDFPDPKSKKIADILEPWIPVR